MIRQYVEKHTIKNETVTQSNIIYSSVMDTLHKDMLEVIFAYIADIRTLRVNKYLNSVIIAHQEFTFWAAYTDNSIYKYGKIKMLSLVKLTVYGFIDACIFDNAEMVKYLVERDFHVNVSCGVALRAACVNNNIDLAKYLIDKKADIGVQNSFPLKIACERGYSDLAKYLIETKADIYAGENCCIKHAIAGDNLELVKYIFDAGYDIKNNGGLIVFACERNSIRSLEYLISRDDIARFGGDSLIRASEGGYPELVKSLLSANVDARARNNKSIRVASFMGHVSVVKILLNAKADARAKNSCSVKLAAEGGHINTIKILFAANADIHTDSYEPLHSACRYGYMRLVKFLVRHNADIYSQDNRAIVCAHEGNKNNIVKYLMRTMNL